LPSLEDVENVLRNGTPRTKPATVTTLVVAGESMPVRTEKPAE
jgi:hypothetical protein